MSVTTRPELKEHETHEVVCVIYASGVNAAIECEDCHVVIIDCDNTDESAEEYDLIAAHVGHALEIVDYRNSTVVACMACGDELHKVKQQAA